MSGIIGGLGSKSGVIGSGVTFPAGHILQVVGTNFTTIGNTTITTSPTVSSPNITYPITPLRNGSWFRISVRWFGEQANSFNIMALMYRDSASINSAAAGTSSGINVKGLSMATHTFNSAVNDATTPELMHLDTLDKTGSTAGTEIDYTLKWIAQGSYTQHTNITFTQSGGDTSWEEGVSEIIIMEIAQ